MKKVIKIFTVVLAVLLLVSNVKAIETSFTSDFKGFGIDFDNSLNKTRIYHNELIPGAPNNYTLFKISSPIKNTEDNYADGKILYCSDGNLDSPNLESDSAPFDTNCKILKGSGSNDKSIAYIYENGYGTYKSNYSATEYLTGDMINDYYITQAAIWHFTEPVSWLNNFNLSAGTYNGQSNEITKKIAKLILDAESASSGASLEMSISNTKMSLTNDGKYYISSPIKLTGKYINSNITTSLSGANNAFVTTDQNATSGTTTFNNNSTVYIKVPASSVTNETNITLKISATTSIEDSEAIECEHRQAATYRLQPVMIFYPKNTNLSDSISVNASASTPVSKYDVKISKKDINNTEELEGATLTIKNADGTVVTSWVSDKTTKTISLLPGSYTLEETIAPDGYIKSTSKIDFTVDNTGKVLVGGKEVEEIIITNDPIIITISKRSITGSDELPGAKLKITDRDGNIVKDIQGNELEWISEATPRSFNLKIGDYILSETIAPEGYELSESTIEFTINSEGKVLVAGQEVENNLIIFENTPEPKQVPTGNAIIYVAGTMCIAALGVAIYYIIKRKEL